MGARVSAKRTDGRKGRSERSETLVESVRRKALDDIVQGVIQPGTMVGLADLAAKYGVSRTPVREAFTLLAQEGLVTPIAGKGYLVRPIEPRDVQETYFVRRVLEGAAAEVAAEMMTEEDLGRLRALRPPQGSRMTLAYDEYSHDFHRIIVVAAGVSRLTHLFENVYTDVRRIQYAGIGNPRPDLIHHEHDQIVEALSDRDPVAARQLMEDHIEAVRTRALEQWLMSLDRTNRRDETSAAESKDRK